MSENVLNQIREILLPEYPPSPGIGNAPIGIVQHVAGSFTIREDGLYLFRQRIQKPTGEIQEKNSLQQLKKGDHIELPGISHTTITYLGR